MKITALILVVLVAAATAAPHHSPYVAHPVSHVAELGRPRRDVTYVDVSNLQSGTRLVAAQPQSQRTGVITGATDAWKVAVTGALDLFTAGRPSGIGV